jgi:acetyl-CoA/propionyl-CoA carboxylase biotin carboxyl carrier protein
LTTRNYVIDGKPFDVEIVERSGTHAVVRVNGKTHRVEAESVLEKTTLSAVVNAPVARRPARAAAGDVRAPMAGRIVQLHFQAGEHVAAGAPLLVLDAMKMENTLQAPRAGRVEEIAVGVGDTVLQGALLIRLA